MKKHYKDYDEPLWMQEPELEPSSVNWGCVGIMLLTVVVYGLLGIGLYYAALWVARMVWP